MQGALIIKYVKKTCQNSLTGLFGGEYRDRTGDLLHAMQALSQLS